jgi:hypothetical protein
MDKKKNFNRCMAMKKVVFILFASMLFLASCIDTGIRGDGNIVSQEREVSDFYGLTIDGVANVNVQSGEEYKLVVTTDDNLQDFVLLEVKNGILHINTKENTNLRPTKLIIDVHLPELQSISINGVGNVKIFNGNASDLKISLSGVGNIDAQNYQVQNVIINSSGVGNAKVWATNSLDGTLSGVGNIQYKGNPKVSVSVSGVGKVNKL